MDVDGVQLEENVEVVDAYREVHGNDVKEFLLVVDDGEAEVGWPSKFH